MQLRFGPIDEISVVTMQAVSGAGYPGVSSMDIVDNVVPYIKGEEDKLQPEAQKILGAVNNDSTSFEPQSSLRISAACNRVPVLDGHTACVSLRFRNRPPPSPEDAKEALRTYRSEAQELNCPSAPEHAVVVLTEPDRPQPRLDRDLHGGYAVSVGRVRNDDSGIFDLQYVALSHNSEFSDHAPPEQRATWMPEPFVSLFGNAADMTSLCSGHRRSRFVHLERRSSRSQGIRVASHRHFQKRRENHLAPEGKGRRGAGAAKSGLGAFKSFLQTQDIRIRRHVEAYIHRSFGTSYLTTL